MPLIDREQAARVASVVAGLRVEPDPFTDPDLYPPEGDDPEHVARYFLVMVAMDHRLSRPGAPYEAVVDGRRYHGADLLYKLGARMYRERRSFFSPEELERVGPRDVEEWLCVGRACPPDLEARAALLRDLGRKLRLLYGGRATAIIELSGGRLYGAPHEPGLVDLLRVFAAYQDPVDKKALLLAKFLERRGLLRVRDPWEKRVPVDNHVTRIALRLGLVRLEEELASKLLSRRQFGWHEDVLVRAAVREAWQLVARAAGLDPFLLDDLLWTMGRRVCTASAPRCRGCSGHPACREGRCAFLPVCPAGLGAAPMVAEHPFYATWWY